MRLRARPLSHAELAELAGTPSRPEHLFLQNHILFEVQRLREDVGADPRGTFYGVFDREGMQLVAFFARGGLLVLGAGSVEAAAALKGPALVEERGFRILIGPERPVAALVEELGERVKIEMNRRQPFLVVRDAADLGEGCAMRPALPGDLPWLVEANLELNEEDLGIAASRVDRRALEVRLGVRVAEGRTWIVDHAGRPAAKLNVGLSGPAGALIEGVYTEPALRGKGFAGRLVAAVSRRLLGSYPCVGLHTARDNAPALRAYRRAGLVECAELRLVRPSW
ncbi:MAG: GNAT family N-acetyltransferase [Planctomycetota bacterium]